MDPLAEEELAFWEVVGGNNDAGGSQNAGMSDGEVKLEEFVQLGYLW